MGYRSEVLIRIKHSYPEKHKSILVDLFLKKLPWVKIIQKAVMEDNCCHWTDKEILIYGDSWKWYDDYEDVTAANQMWAYFKEIGNDDDGLNGCYIRIGESSDDIEEYFIGDGYQLGRTESSIYWEE